MKLHEVFGMAAPRVPVPSDEWPIPDCLVGLEFEYENPKGNAWVERWWDRKLPEISLAWATHDDGSLRDNGVEFVLRDPLMGKDLSDAISLLLDPMPPLETTYRTSVHVHIDARDLELSELKTAVLLYALTEQGFFNYVGGQRETNNYCIPWYEAPEYLFPVSKALFDAEVDKGILGRACANAQRYAALNINALRKYGSLEFRHYGDNVTEARIREWIGICLQLKLAARMIPYERAEQLVYEPADHVYNVVFGKYADLMLRGLTEEKHDTCQSSAGLLMSYIAAAHAADTFEKYVPDTREVNPVWKRSVEQMKESA